MNKEQLLGLKEGQFVMYCGDSDYARGIIKGYIFQVEMTGDVGFRMRNVEKKQSIVVTEHNRDESRNVRFYKVIPNVPESEDDVTELKQDDFEMLIDYALDIKDFVWAQELYAAGQSFDF